MINLDFTSHLKTFNPGSTPVFCHSPELIHSHSNVVLLVNEVHKTPRMPCQEIIIFEAIAIIFPLYKCAHSWGSEESPKYSSPCDAGC